jgi:hypothetical protein
MLSNKKSEILNNWIDRETPGRKCGKWCKYHKPDWTHRDTRCILSDVFSVRVGEICKNGEE